MLGTGLRFGLDRALPHADNGFPFSTLTANTLGALVLGLLVGSLWPRASSWLRAGLGTGILGSFTTFSAIAISVVSLVRSDQWGIAIGYLVITLVLGFVAAWAGLNLGLKLPGHQPGKQEPLVETE